MSQSRSRGGKAPRPPQRRARVTLPVVVISGAVALFAFAVGMQIWNSTRGEGNGGGAEAASAKSHSLPDGAIQVAGVEVLAPVADAGRVPLNTGVEKQWMLKNTGTGPVTLGRATIKVLEGC
ncbi:MAG: hypothetical protein HY875_02430 [Chloroflexi bacterium]|nr:hypothetical protein [Chloroflexota bacterium]